MTSLILVALGLSGWTPAAATNMGSDHFDAGPPAALDQVIYHLDNGIGAGSYYLSDGHDYIAGRFDTFGVRDPHALTSVGWYGFLRDAAGIEFYVAPSRPDGPGHAFRLGSYNDSNIGAPTWHILDRLEPYVVHPGAYYYLIVKVDSNSSENYWWTSYDLGSEPEGAYGSNDLEDWSLAVHTTESGRLCAMDIQGVEASVSGLEVHVYETPECVNPPASVEYGVTVINVGEEDATFDAVRLEASGPMPNPYEELLLEREVVIPPRGSVSGTVEVVVPGMAPGGIYTVNTVVSSEGTDVGSVSFESVVQSQPCE